MWNSKFKVFTHAEYENMEFRGVKWTGGICSKLAVKLLIFVLLLLLLYNNDEWKKINVKINERHRL